MSHRILLSSIAILLTSAASLTAADRFWDGGAINIATDGDGLSDGGAGTWNTTLQNWDQGAALAHVAWVNANNDIAIFGGPGGAVSMGTAVTVGGMTIGAGGYTFTGSAITVVNSGTITANNDVTISNVITRGAIFTKAGAGKLTMTAATNSVTSTLNVTGGILSLNTGAFNALGNTNYTSLAIGSGATISADNTTVTNAHNIGSLTLNGGTLTAGGAVANDGGFGNFILRGNVTIGGSAVSTISTKTLATGNTTRTLTVADSVAGSGVDLNVSAIILDGGLIKEGAGTMAIAAETINTYAGGTTVNAGTLQLGGIAAFSGNGNIRGVLTINANGTVKSTSKDSLGYNTNGTQVTTMNIAGGTYDNASNGNQGFSTNVAMTGGLLSSTGGGRFFFNTGFGLSSNAAATRAIVSSGVAVYGNTITVAPGTTGDGIDLEIAGVISNGGGTNSITKAGAGRLELTGVNSYTGATNVNGGTLLVSGSISGSLSVTVDNSGTLLLGGTTNAGEGRIKDTASFTFGANSGVKTLALATNNTAQISETAGALNLGSDAIIDLGTGTSGGIIGFGESSATFGSGGLSIWNWSGSTSGGGLDRVLFTGSLSQTQLQQITFYSGGGTGLLGTGSAISFGGTIEVVPIPELASSGLLGVAALLGLIGFRTRRLPSSPSSRSVRAV